MPIKVFKKLILIIFLSNILKDFFLNFFCEAGPFTKGLFHSQRA